MSYTVSPEIRASFEKALGIPEVQKAFEWIRENYPADLEEHKAFIACEAPTGCEQARARMYADKLAAAGLTDVKVDEYTNVTGWWKGSGCGPVLMIEAHLDTVFPYGSVKEILDNGEEIHAPGATDDTRGLTAILDALRAMKAAGLKPAGDILFAATSREEGIGGFGGMKDMLAHGPRLDASISVDGASTECVACEATGIRTFSVTFHGIGGHACSDFARVANPLHAAARAVAKIADFEVPSEPMTTFAVTNFHAGNMAGIHAIVPEATIKFNFRSNRQEELDRLGERIFAAVQEACDEETSRWGKDTITWDREVYCYSPAGQEDHHLPIVEAGVLAARYFSPDPLEEPIRKGGSVNGNMAIGAGIPCITIGGGPLNKKIHSMEEYFPYKEGWRLSEEIVLLLCMCAGVEGKLSPIITKRAEKQ